MLLLLSVVLLAGVRLMARATLVLELELLVVPLLLVIWQPQQLTLPLPPMQQSALQWMLQWSKVELLNPLL